MENFIEKSNFEPDEKMILVVHYPTAFLLAFTLSLIASLYFYPAETKYAIRSVVNSVDKFLKRKDLMEKSSGTKVDKPMAQASGNQNSNVVTNDGSKLEGRKRKIPERSLKVIGCLDVSEFLGVDEISEVTQDKNIEAVKSDLLKIGVARKLTDKSGGKRNFGRSKVEKSPEEVPIKKKFSKSSFGE